MFDGLSLDKFMSDVGTEMAQQFTQGQHELAAALFNGSAFVMYPRGGEDDMEATGEEQMSMEQLRAEAPQIETGMDRGLEM